MTRKKNNKNITRSIHMENADTSTTLTCDLDLTSRSRKLMSLEVAYCIVPWYPIWCLWARYDHHLIFCYLWPSPVTFSIIMSSKSLIIRCTLYHCTLVPSMKFVGSIEYEIWTIVCRKLKWRHNDVIIHSNFMKFKHMSTKGISKRKNKFHFDRMIESWDRK